MRGQELIEKITEVVKQVVNCIADRRYEELADLVSYRQIAYRQSIKPGESSKDFFLEFGEWLDEQLALWAEDEGRSFVVDHFDEKYFKEEELSELEEELEYWEEDWEKDEFFVAVEYYPKNAGERLDFWFEFNFQRGDDDQLTASFDCNI